MYFVLMMKLLTGDIYTIRVRAATKWLRYSHNEKSVFAPLREFCWGLPEYFFSSTIICLKKGKYNVHPVLSLVL